MVDGPRDGCAGGVVLAALTARPLAFHEGPLVIPLRQALVVRHHCQGDTKTQLSFLNNGVSKGGRVTYLLS